MRKREEVQEVLWRAGAMNVPQSEFQHNKEFIGHGPQGFSRIKLLRDRLIRVIRVIRVLLRSLTLPLERTYDAISR